MRKLLAMTLLITAGCTALGPGGIDRALHEGPRDFLAQAVVGPQGDGTYVVPTTQIVDPAGETVLFPGRPVGLALHPDGAMLAVKNRTNVVFMDIRSQEIIQTLDMPEDGASFCGIAWSADGKTLWTTSAERFLHGAMSSGEGIYVWSAGIELPGPSGKGAPAPGGIALDPEGAHTWVTLSRNNTLALVNLSSGAVETEIPVGVAPYDVQLNGNKAYVTNWGGRQPVDGDLTGPSSESKVVIDERGVASTGSVSVIDVISRRVIREIEVDLHPSGMAFSPDGSRLYVANANSDTVSVIDTRTDGIVARFGTRPMESLPFGSAPNAICVSRDGGTLYVANGGNNCIAVLDAATGTIQGLIPTGWYPGAVTLDAPGNTLIIANTKGVGSRDQDPKSMAARLSQYMGKPVAEGDFYNSHYHMGSVSFVPVPDKATLSDYTYRVAVNMRLPLMNEVMTLPQAEARRVPVPVRPGELSKFKHVIYIIKENRTYDQIFGDMPQGNGDPALCHFGYEVTPNHHALAEEFVLLDNFYCNGVLSADGHQWAAEGYVTDYIEKSFGGFTRSYPYDGDDAIAYASSGFIWDHVLAKGLSFRNYGEMVQATITPGDASWTQIYEDYKNGTKTVEIKAHTLVKGLEDYTCPSFIGFPGKVQDVYRAQEFLRELEEFEANGDLPNFITMLLPNDHTVGTREGYPTPRATVADNDLALGMVVSALTKSRFWPETLILVAEDDPQAGLDHVDGHRTVALCISPYTKRGYVDSSHYTQTSLLRTIELVLGLAPMNQLTMAANPMLGCFEETLDTTPYEVRENQIPLDEMNPQVNATRGKQHYYAKRSMEMPLDDIDQADEGLFNRIIWHSVKGYDTPYPRLRPRPHRSAEAGPGALAARDDD